ncbi:MAG: DUF2306 domain-containing protein [Beijerinckiaceae bacterium]
MTLAPFFAASITIKIHIIVMLVAIVITPVQMFGRKGTFIHKAAGYCWMSAMFAAAVTSLGIRSSDPISYMGFSPIHLLSVLVIVNVPLAIMAARSGNIKRHKSAVTNMVWGGVVAAGVFTLAPGRIMHQIIFGV